MEGVGGKGHTPVWVCGDDGDCDCVRAVSGLTAHHPLPTDPDYPHHQALRFLSEMPTASKSARVVVMPNPVDPAATTPATLFEALLWAAGGLKETVPRQQVS